MQQQLVAGDARIVDEDVDAAEVLADPAEGFLDERKVGHVAFVGRGADAEGLRFGDRFGRALVRAGVHDGDVGAVLGERDRNGRADAARAAGDDRRFAFEKHKLLSFPFFFVVRLRRLHAERKRLGVLHVEDLRLGQNAPDQARQHLARPDLAEEVGARISHMPHGFLPAHGAFHLRGQRRAQVARVGTRGQVGVERQRRLAQFDACEVRRQPSVINGE